MDSEPHPPLTAAEKAIVEALVAEGLAIQAKFRPEPLYRQTGKGYYEGDSVEEIRRVRESSEEDAR